MCVCVCVCVWSVICERIGVLIIGREARKKKGTDRAREIYKNGYIERERERREEGRKRRRNESDNAQMQEGEREGGREGREGQMSEL